MAITSYGYAGTILPGASWATMRYVLGRDFTAPFVDHGRVSVVATGTRTVRVSTGYLGGQGVVDHITTAEDVTLPNVTSGSQYFLIVLRRTWQTTNRSTVVVINGTSARQIPTFQKNAGVVHDQPLALVRVTAGQTVPTEVVDLRVIAEESGVYTIFDDLALPLAERVGLTVYNAKTGFTYRRVYNASGTAEWQRVNPVPGTLLAVYSIAWRNLPPAGGLGESVRVWGVSPEWISANTIPDPGVPYRVAAEVGGWFGSESWTAPRRWDFDLQVGGVAISTYIPNSSEAKAYNSYKNWTIQPSTQVFTGSKQVNIVARKIEAGGHQYGALATANRQGRIIIYAA